jgi:hypothetical protein
MGLANDFNTKVIDGEIESGGVLILLYKRYYSGVAGKRNCCRLYRRQCSGTGNKAKMLLCALAYCTILVHLESW